jgi:hypothetical protein
MIVSKRWKGSAPAPIFEKKFQKDKKTTNDYMYICLPSVYIEKTSLVSSSSGKAQQVRLKQPEPNMQEVKFSTRFLPCV